MICYDIIPLRVLKKIIYACFGLIEDVASKLFEWLYYLRDLSLYGFKVLHVLRAKTEILWIFVTKARKFSPTSGGNSLYKYCIPHSQFLIQNKEVQEKGKQYELPGEEFLSPYSEFL